MPYCKKRLVSYPASTPLPEASHSTTKTLLKSEVANTGEVTRACFSVLNAASAFLVQISFP